MHYIRIREAEWESQLRNISADGFNLIDTYVPWSIHGPEEGSSTSARFSAFSIWQNAMDFMSSPGRGHTFAANLTKVGFRDGPQVQGIGFRSNSERSRKWTKKILSNPGGSRRYHNSSVGRFVS